jgi:release factor glutamine methyltransferase
VYAAAVSRRVAREPLAYITGDTEFMGFRFRCDPRALVPRPDTETLVLLAAHLLSAFAPDRPTIVDVGTGTGCIGVSLARILPHSTVLLTDISPDALALATENARANGVREQVRPLCGAFLCPVLHAGLAADVVAVVSNPPYVPAGELAGLEPEVSRHEPRIALDGGPDGLDAFRRLLRQAVDLPALRLLALEVGIGQAEEVARMMADHFRGWAVQVRADLGGVPRVVWTQRSAGG